MEGGRMRNLGWSLLVSCALIGRSESAAMRLAVELCVPSPAPAEPQSGPPDIAKIEVVGAPVKFFDHTQRMEELNWADGPVNAWREADGTVNLMISTYEAYRMRGPDLLNLSLDRNKIYSATRDGGFIQENLYNN